MISGFFTKRDLQLIHIHMNQEYRESHRCVVVVRCPVVVLRQKESHRSALLQCVAICVAYEIDTMSRLHKLLGLFCKKTSRRRVLL